MGGGARTINFPSREKCFCLTYFAGRPDVYRVLKCANGIGISDFTTICIQQKLIEKKRKHAIRVSRIAFRNVGAKPPGKFLRTRPLLLPRMHLSTQCLPVLNLDIDNFVTIVE